MRTLHLSNLHARAARPIHAHTLHVTYCTPDGTRTVVAGGLHEAHAHDLAALLSESPRVAAVHVVAPESVAA